VAKSDTAVLDKPTPVPPTGDPALDVVMVLKDQTVTVAELLTAVDELDVAEAWAAGDVQFGHRNYATQTGGRDANGRDLRTRLTVESAWTWTGAKAADRVGFSELWAEWKDFPGDFDEYRFYPPAPKVRVPDSEAHRSPLQEIDRAGACELAALHVKLTDAGLTRLRKLRRNEPTA
jgi:hypothetical protein